jgi:hypothetical protein
MENVPIFRFNFSEEINKELGYFAKLHKHEDRTDFKENWQKWIEENEDLINKESERLKTLGYDGDIKDKMYKSTRYYFRKKPLRNEPIERGTRVVVSKELLEQMDEHIKNNHFNQNYTPQIAYEEFCNEYAELINNEINDLNIDNNETSQNKIKKTYKNRFYVIVRQNKEEKQKNKKQTKKEVEVEEEKEDN